MTRPCPSPELIVAAQTGDRRALDALIRESLWVVRAQAKRAKRPDVYEDLVQVGLSGGVERSGLLRGIEKFDPTKGANFWTFVTVWIWGAIRREISTRQSDDVFSARRRYIRLRAKTKVRLARTLGREPADEEVVEIIGEAPKRKRDTPAYTNPKDLNADTGKISGLGNVDITNASDGMSEGRMVRALTGRRAVRLIGELPDLEGRAVTLHYLEGKTFAEIGASMSISREWARQHVLTGCMRLRSMLNANAADVAAAAE